MAGDPVVLKLRGRWAELITPRRRLVLVIEASPARHRQENEFKAQAEGGETLFGKFKVAWNAPFSSHPNKGLKHRPIHYGMFLLASSKHKGKQQLLEAVQPRGT